MQRPDSLSHAVTARHGGYDEGRKILRPQLDRRAMRRAVGGVVPGVAVAVQGIRGRDALGRDQPLQRRQPVPVIGLAGVGIAFGLRALDFLGERGGPFVPGEQAALMQRQRHRKGLRFPGLAKHRAVGVAGNAGNGAGGVVGGSRVERHQAGSR